MRIAIRADASLEIGIGHVMRCLTLANELQRRGTSVFFISRELRGDARSLIRAAGFDVETLTKTGESEMGPLAHARWLPVSRDVDAEETLMILEKKGGVDWLVVDHYALDSTWEQMVRRKASRILVIDDLADRSHDADILLDQGLHSDSYERYKNLVPKSARIFVGPQYALLRGEFRKARRNLRARSGGIKRILIFFGGADITNQTARALRVVASLKHPDLELDVVVGSMNPHIEEVRKLCRATPGATLHVWVSNMAELMARADLAIGGGGTATWERCILGLPCMTLTMAENQKEMAAAMARAGAAWSLGPAKLVSDEEVSVALEHAFKNPEKVHAMSVAASAIMGKNEGVETFLAAILEVSNVR